jgi:hypothetical protein
MGRTDEAFNELRLACASDASLLPKAIDLAWGSYQKDPALTVNVVRPQTDVARMSLAIFFAQRGQGSAAMDQYRQTQSHSDRVHDLLRALLQARLFVEAGEVWAKVHGARIPIASVMNAGFEEEIAVGGEAFGWQIPDNVPNVLMSIDAAEHHSGAKSLRIDFQGESNSETRLISQLVLVQPDNRYRLTFQSSSKQFASIAPPAVTVMDASAENESPLAHAKALSDSGWREVALDFTTGPGTQAIRLILQRQDCPSAPCPAFGTVWLDSFHLAPAQKQ